ncbi:nuclear transport factor 2 family protein [Halomonas sp. TRM85114]|uniref:nuclear transport factor 2 family protein n=1 Tax=Halomonas jincaotanensis TaxID=2810616 RepID=UPI001BD40A99|nr:nuclear transport factor 2 family protein [Halomonas jincaotanensis]MBS9404948.1 nuclear transport factor 2 family protein [Halomonas jincaotanensis]
MIQDSDLQVFCAFFNKLDKTCTKNLDKVYSADVTFDDPIHHFEGITALEAYYQSLYNNVTSCHFIFHQSQRQGDDAFVTWTMKLVHPRLDSGKPIEVEGCSHLRFAADGRVAQQRDYFDVGAMIYERLPLLGRMVKGIKQRLGR